MRGKGACHHFTLCAIKAATTRLGRCVVRALTCTLTFENAAKVTATASAKSPRQRVAMEYSGAVERLPRKVCGDGNLAFLKFYLIGLAQSEGAKIEYHEEGEWDVLPSDSRF